MRIRVNAMNSGAETKHVIFACPVTNKNVQHRFEATAHDYESVNCLACDRVHFINVRNGKVLGRDKG